MSRVTPTPVTVCVRNRWYVGTLRSCEVAEDGSTCTGVVTYMSLDRGLQTGRFPATHMRKASGEPGCPVDHEDVTCGPSATLTPCC